MSTFRSFLCDDRGQSLVEYALIITLVAMVALFGLILLGKKSNNTLNRAANSLTD